MRVGPLQGGLAMDVISTEPVAVTTLGGGICLAAVLNICLCCFRRHDDNEVLKHIIISIILSVSENASCSSMGLRLTNVMTSVSDVGRLIRTFVLYADISLIRGSV